MNDYKPLRTTRRITNLLARNNWYSIKAMATGPSQVSIYDEIGFSGITASNFINDLTNVHGDLEVHLSTPGGEVFDGIAIYNYLKNRGGTVSVIVDSLAASIGSVIAMAASPGHLMIGKNAQMMIHDGFGLTIGNAADMRQMADLLDKTSDNIASIYADRTGKSAASWRTAMRAETWYSAQEAVAAGLADSIQGEAPRNSWDLSIYNAAPYQPEPYKQESDEDVKCPVCGKMNSPDARYCDQCGTKLTGRTDVTEVGNRFANSAPYQPDPYKQETDEDIKCPVCGKMNSPDAKYCDQCGTKLAGRTDVTEMDNRFINAAVDNSPWDANKAWHNGAASDDPAAFYAGICAGRKAGDKSTQQAWALPYKYHPGDPPNASAVRNGLARLDQTEGLTNKAEARATLESAMKKINPDYKASDLSSDDLWAIITPDLFALKLDKKEG